MSNVVMVDYGVGNVFSLLHALKRIGIDCVLSDNYATIQQASCIILPGVGAFKDAMTQLEVKGLDVVLKQLQPKQRLIGICLGMQLLYDASEEFGLHTGLGILRGSIIRFPTSTLKIPHMGWNPLSSNQWDHPLLKGCDSTSFVYYVHSYYASRINPTSLVAFSNYGVDVPGIVMQDNVIGFQFHPEKSGAVGEQLLRNVFEGYV